MRGVGRLKNMIWKGMASRAASAPVACVATAWTCLVRQRLGGIAPADKLAERVLVVPTAVFHQIGLPGFNPSSSTPPMTRSRTSPIVRVLTRKTIRASQLDPYVIRGTTRCSRIRRQAGHGGRLSARSFGVGGHISADDAGLFRSRLTARRCSAKWLSK